MNDHKPSDSDIVTLLAVQHYKAISPVGGQVSWFILGKKISSASLSLSLCLSLSANG